jgi:cardiolipin synthase
MIRVILNMLCRDQEGNCYECKTRWLWGSVMAVTRPSGAGSSPVANPVGKPAQSGSRATSQSNAGVSQLDVRGRADREHQIVREDTNALSPVVRSGRLKSQFWTAPNQLTLLRLIFIPFVIINVLDGEWHWALGLLVAAGLSDALDGWLARALDQRTMLGQYLDPIADKLLLSSLFLVLAFVKKIPWRYTVLVLSRDVLIVAICMVLYATVGFRDFRPSIFGKINTVCQIGAVFFVVLAQVFNPPTVLLLEKLFLYATFAFTTISGIHYVLITGYRLRHADSKLPAS